MQCIPIVVGVGNDIHSYTTSYEKARSATTCTATTRSKLILTCAISGSSITVLPWCVVSAHVTTTIMSNQTSVPNSDLDPKPLVLCRNFSLIMFKHL